MSASGERKGCEKKRILLVCLFLLIFFLVCSRRFHHLTETISNSKILISANAINQLKAEYKKRNTVSHEIPTEVPVQSESGFVLVSQYSDQMTGASLNLLSLQCWASALGNDVRVVEPFLVKGSKFGVDVSLEPGEERREQVLRVRLRDIVDIEAWGNETIKRGFAPLVSWVDFLKQAPRSLILVDAECSRRSDSDKCTEFENRFRKPAFQFAKQHNFTVVRAVQMKRILYTARDFEHLVYGDYSPNNSVVLFNYWGGIHDNHPRAYRVGISDMKHCNRLTFSSFLFRSSKTIRDDSQRYVKQYMPLARNSGYISVMFRSERFGLAHGFHDVHSEGEKLSTLTDCVQSIVGCVDKLRQQYSIQSVFLAMDCRKQGSMAFRRLSSPAYMSRELVDVVAQDLYQSIYGNSSSLDEWDESFDSVATFKAAGYLAQLQKSLAANGTCLLTAGGGNFQQSAERLYREMHKSHCTIQIPGCM